MSHASVTLIGNLGADPELKYSSDGSASCKLRLAVNSKRRRDDGTEEIVNWYAIRCYGRLAETVNQYLRKGSKVTVIGTLTVRDYTTQEGQPRYSLDVSADHVVFMDSARSAPTGDTAKPQVDIPW